MMLSPKVFRDEANYREIAGLWLGLGTLLGVLGLFFASLALLFLIGMFERGELSLLAFLTRTGLIAGYILCPIVGWVLFARRRYWAAIVAAIWPILSVGLFLAAHIL